MSQDLGILLIAWAALLFSAIYGTSQFFDELSPVQKLALASVGYLAGSWAFIVVNFDDFGVSFYPDLIKPLLGMVPAGSMGLAVTVGNGAIFKHHINRIDFLTLPLSIVIVATMWGARFEMLTAYGLERYGYLQQLDERARRGDSSRHDAFSLVLSSDRPFEIREPLEDKESLIQLFQSTNLKHQDYARQAVANGKLNLDDIDLFRTGDGRNLAAETRLARRIVDALSERTLGKFDTEPIRQRHWTKIISEASAYASVKSKRKAEDWGFKNAARANKVGETWLAEIERVRRANPELESDIPALPK